MKITSRLKRFSYTAGGVATILVGVLLVILGTSELFSLDVFELPVPAETPGLVVMFLGIYLLFRGRHYSSGDHDPEEHLPFTRDVRDDIDRMHDDADDNRDGA